MAERRIPFEEVDLISGLFGSFDSNIRILEDEYHVTAVNRGGELKLTGDDEAKVEAAARAVQGMLVLLKKGEQLNEQNIHYVISMVNEGADRKLSKLMADAICITSRGKPVKAKTLGQEAYVEAIRDNTVVFGIGPAGTGKTYLAVAMAVKAFKAKEVNRIILTRPAVEAGESLGFLPGDLQQKVDPYLRPLYDALFDMLGAESFQKQLERGSIEVAPLAYMRGRTLDDSFIILDEAQNTTSEQMKMFLTRLGSNSKAVVTGDVTQIDLPRSTQSGLVRALRVLDGVAGVGRVEFGKKDIVRHALVQRIVEAYEKAEAAEEQGRLQAAAEASTADSKEISNNQ